MNDRWVGGHRHGIHFFRIGDFRPTYAVSAQTCERPDVTGADMLALT
jgi:hypothetical protein